jgi:hypothetical protein
MRASGVRAAWSLKRAMISLPDTAEHRGVVDRGIFS